jgi:hypothetical protein
LVNQNKYKPGHKRENVRLLISFEKAFINEFLRIILSPRYWEFSPIKLGEKNFFALGLGPIFDPKNTVGKSLQVF